MRVAFLAAVVALAAAQSDITKFEIFTPKLISQEFASPMDKYPSHVRAQIQYNGQDLFLDMNVDRDLFDKDWFLETTHEDGTVTRTTNTSDFMCHYTGSVTNAAASAVTMSLCDQLGMRGTVFTPEFRIEVQHGIPLHMLNGAHKEFRSFHGEPHIVFNLEDVKLEGVLGEPLTPTGDFLVNGHYGDDPTIQANAACITASDNSRMNAFSSGGAEAQNTQSCMAQSNSRYAQTSWSGGSQLRHSIGGQVQRPSGWSFSSNMNTYLSNLSRYKQSSHAGRDNVVGLTHTSFGGTIGLAWLNTMCQAANSCGLNNVGWSNSDSARGVLIAHEIGHNFAFAHDQSPQTGFVMWPSIITGASRFSATSVNRFAQVRGNFRCL